MSRRTPRAPGALPKVSAGLARVLFPAGLGGALFLSAVATPVAGRPLKARDVSTIREWQFSAAYGGGVEYLVDPVPAGKSNDPEWAFLNGAGFRVWLGCDSPDPARSQWRFRVEVSAPASGMTGDEERAFDAGVAFALGAPGSLVIFDELDKPFRRVALVPRNGRLETDVLKADDVRRFSDSPILRVETPRLKLETGTAGIFLNLVVKKPRLACRGA